MWWKMRCIIYWQQQHTWYYPATLVQTRLFVFDGDGYSIYTNVWLRGNSSLQADGGGLCLISNPHPPNPPSSSCDWYLLFRTVVGFLLMNGNGMMKGDRECIDATLFNLFVSQQPCIWIVFQGMMMLVRRNNNDSTLKIFLSPCYPPLWNASFRKVSLGCQGKSFSNPDIWKPAHEFPQTKHFHYPLSFLSSFFPIKKKNGTYVFRIDLLTLILSIGSSHCIPHPLGKVTFKGFTSFTISFVSIAGIL